MARESDGKLSSANPAIELPCAAPVAIWEKESVRDQRELLVRVVKE
jgi:hypothetical protein